MLFQCIMRYGHRRIPAKVILVIQNISPLRYNPDYLPRPPAADDFVLLFRGGDVLLRRDARGPSLPLYGMLRGMGSDLDTALTYLFSVDDRAFYLALHVDPPHDEEFRFEPVRVFRTFVPSWQAFAAITAHHLHLWYSVRIFCGACGERMRHGETMRVMTCGACGNIEYPRISPAVIVGVTHGDKLLVTKYAGREYAKYSLVAGFVEVGETLEDTVRREVMEEVGLGVTNIRYYKSQPWAFSGTLLGGFFADLDGPDHIRLNPDELAEAAWVHGCEIGGNADFDLNSISLTSEMIALFRAGNVPR